MEVGGMDAGVSGMLGRPDLANGYASYLAPIAGTPAGGGGMMGGSGISGGVSLQGNVGTGQASLGLAAALVIAYMVVYWTSRGIQH